MEIVRELVAPVAPHALFTYVDDLDAYPSWMPLIHTVERLDPDAAGGGLWSVELRASVGPFARSKRLRMRRTARRPDKLAVFEREEDDGRRHSDWILRAELSPVPVESNVPAAAGSAPSSGSHTRLVMTMVYGGSLWSGLGLDRVLDEQVRLGSEALLALVTESA